MKEHELYLIEILRDEGKTFLGSNFIEYLKDKAISMGIKGLIPYNSLVPKEIIER